MCLPMSPPQDSSALTYYLIHPPWSLQVKVATMDLWTEMRLAVVQGVHQVVVIDFQDDSVLVQLAHGDAFCRAVDDPHVDSKSFHQE